MTCSREMEGDVIDEVAAPTHGSHLVECLDYAIDKDLVDVILVAYSFGQDPTFIDKVRHTFHWAAIQTDLPRVLEKAKKKDVGVVVMKTLMGGRLNDMRPYERPGGTFSQAALRWEVQICSFVPPM